MVIKKSFEDFRLLRNSQISDTKKFASTDTKLFGANEILDTGNRVYQGLILKDGLNWLNLKKENRMHWKKEGLLQSF